VTLIAFLPALLEGALMTLAVAAASLAVALFLGMLGAACKLSGNGLLRRLAILYTTAIRGVPDLVLMLLIFYGGQMLVNVMVERLGLAEGIDVNPFVAGVLTIGFIFGAYLTETFRGAIQSIPPGQSEAARAYGMAPAQVLTRIVLPQMVRHAIPGFTNNWLVLLKSTALVSVIGLTDMMHKAGLAAGATREPFTFYLAVAALYLLFTSVSLLALSRLEARFSLGVRRSP
jgi:arginine/ornithine transport system permease protein